MADNTFGDSDNPWGNDPAGGGTDQPQIPQDQQAPQDPFPPATSDPVIFSPSMPPIPVPPPPPTMAPPGVGTYYGNQTGYGVSGPSNDGMAIASMVVGILGLVGFCLWFIAGILDVIAIVLGGVSLARIKNSNGYLGGKGFAIAGLTCGIIGIILIILFFVFAFALNTNF
jgi:hypothetical protein